jgi:hypothetical protein
MASFGARLAMDVNVGVDRIGEGPKRAMVVVLGLLAALMLSLLFKPRQPSPFTDHGAYGAGYGSESVMFGASSRPGAAR